MVHYNTYWYPRDRSGEKNNEFTADPRSQIYLENIKPSFAFTLFSGWVALYQTLDNGQRQILRIALPGDLLGFQRHANGTATHSAEAITATKLCAFPVKDFSKMMTDQPEVAARLIEMTARDIAICQQHLVCAGKKTAREKIAYLLLETFHRVRKQVPADFNESDNSIYFPLTQEDIGDTVGLTNVHVNRMIKELEKDGILQCHHRRLSILKEDVMAEIGQFDASMLDDHPLI